MKQRLSEYASAQWQDLFTHRFERYLTIVIPTDEDWFRRVPGGGSMGRVGGFYMRSAHTLFARTVGLTLIHEFTHALHAGDQDAADQHHPIWLTEGLATLFESSQMDDGHAVPQANARLIALQSIVRRKRTIPFDEFVRYSHSKFMQNAMVGYSQGRYMMMYLYEQGVLRQWYDIYVAGFEGDPTGAKAMEDVLGKELAEIEADWKQWVMTLSPPVLRLPPKHAYIGIRLEAEIDGVRVVQVVPGSGADKAGLKAGDVIVDVDDERTFEPQQLMAVVYRHAVGDKVKVRYRRDEKYKAVFVTLTAMPTPGYQPLRAPAPEPEERPQRRNRRPGRRSRQPVEPAKKKAA